MDTATWVGLGAATCMVFGIGFGAGRYTSPESSPLLDVPVASSATADTPKSTSTAPSQRVTSEVRSTTDPADLADCKSSLRFLEGQLETHEGRHSAWPDSALESPVSRTELEHELVKAWDGEAHIVDMRCEEYPCIAVGELIGERKPCCNGLMNLLPDSLNNVRTVTKVIGQSEGGTSFYISFAPPDSWDDQLKLRTDYRISNLVEEYAHD